MIANKCPCYQMPPWLLSFLTIFLPDDCLSWQLSSSQWILYTKYTLWFWPINGDFVKINFDFILDLVRKCINFTFEGYEYAFFSLYDKRMSSDHPLLVWILVFMTSFLHHIGKYPQCPAFSFPRTNDSYLYQRNFHVWLFSFVLSVYLF